MKKLFLILTSIFLLSCAATYSERAYNAGKELEMMEREWSLTDPNWPAKKAIIDRDASFVKSIFPPEQWPVIVSDRYHSISRQFENIQANHKIEATNETGKESKKFRLEPVKKPEDSLETIVGDYKMIEEMYKSGEINQKNYNSQLFTLHVRAEYHARMEALRHRQKAGVARPGETASDQQFLLTPQGTTEDEQIYLQILRGFKEKPI